MGRKFRIDTEELSQAQKELSSVTEIEETLTIFEKQVNFSDNWDSPAGKEFKSEMQSMVLDLKKVETACKQLGFYCGRAKNQAASPINRIGETIETIVEGGFQETGKLLDKIAGLFRW